LDLAEEVAVELAPERRVERVRGGRGLLDEDRLPVHAEADEHLRPEAGLLEVLARHGQLAVVADLERARVLGGEGRHQRYPFFERKLSTSSTNVRAAVTASAAASWPILRSGWSSASARSSINASTDDR